MSWLASTWTLPLVAATVGAAILALLHFLKVQPPRRVVATTLFWRQAVRQEHRRVLIERFSRWRSFLFLLLIVLLLALSLSGLRWSDAQRGEPVVLLIDAGASMSVPSSQGKTRLNEAVEAAEKDLASLGARPVALVSAGDRAQVLVQPGQSAALASQALRSIRPAAVPALSDQALLVAADLLPAGRGRIFWYTDRADLPPEAPAPIRDRVTVRTIGSAAGNAAILSATFEPRSADSVDGRLRIRAGAWGPMPRQLAVRLQRDGATEAQETPLNIDDTGTGDALFENVRADGAAYAVQLASGGALASDDRVGIRLPKRTPIRFNRVGELPEPLVRAVDAIASPDAVNAFAFNVISSTGMPGNEASIQVLRGGSQVASGARVEVIPSPLTDDLKMESAVCGAGTDVRTVHPRAIPLLRAGEHVLAATLPRRPGHLVLSDALFAPGSNVPQRPAFFVLLRRACQQVAGWTAAPIVLPVERRSADPMWVPAGGAETDITAASGSRATSDLSASAPALAPLNSSGAGWRLEPWQLALIAAGGLLVIEALLQSAGRVA